MDAWIAGEINGCRLPDRRLGRRLGRLLEDLSGRIGKPLPLACQDWAGTKAAYRFLDNPRVDEGGILAGHFQATRARFAGSQGLGPGAARQDGAVVPADTLRSHRQDLPGPCRRRQRQTPPPAHDLRAADALQPRGDGGGPAARSRGGQVLDAEEVQGQARTLGRRIARQLIAGDLVLRRVPVTEAASLRRSRLAALGRRPSSIKTIERCDRLLAAHMARRGKAYLDQLSEAALEDFEQTLRTTGVAAAPPSGRTKRAKPTPSPSATASSACAA